MNTDLSLGMIYNHPKMPMTNHIVVAEIVIVIVEITMVRV